MLLKFLGQSVHFDLLHLELLLKAVNVGLHSHAGPLSLLLFKIINLLLKNLDVQLELLFNFNVVSDLSLVNLQLSFVLLWREVQRLERGGEVRCRTTVQVPVSGESVGAAPIVGRLFAFIVILQLHQNFN